MRLNFKKAITANNVIARIFFPATAMSIVWLFSACQFSHAHVGKQDELGVYTLVTVDGIELPATVSHGGVEIKVESGTFKFNADGTCDSKVLFGPPSGSPVTREVKADYTRDGTELKMKWHGAGSTVGTLEGDKFSMNNEGMIFSYKKHASPPLKNPQSVLDKFLGTWRSVHRQLPEGEPATTELTYNRILGGKFIQEKGEVTNENISLAMFTYDAERNCYRMWHFSSDHQTSEGTGKWDPETNTLTWNTVDTAKQEFSMTSKHRFVADDKFEWEVVGKDTNGKNLFQIEGKATRISESKK